MATKDVKYRADVEAQIEILKNTAGNEENRQNAAQRLWMLAEDKDRDVEMYKQKYCIERGAGKPLMSMIKDGNEESKWRAARTLVQLAFGNEVTSAKIAELHAPKHIAALLKDIDNCTDRLKEALLQVICNVASNNWECHSTIVRNGILNHVMYLIKSITTPDDVKRAAINVAYAMTFTPEGRTALMDMDAVIVLVPSIKVNKSTLNSMGATMAAANLVGHLERASMLEGCDVPNKIIMALEHAANREPFGGQYNSLWKVVMALAQLCKAEVNKTTIIENGAVPLLTRLLQLPPDRRDQRLTVHACVCCWHLSFNAAGKAQLCEQAALVDALQDIALDEDQFESAQVARGALWQMAVIPRPPFFDTFIHIYFSFVEEGRERASEISKSVEDAGYVVWKGTEKGLTDEEMCQGVARCAVLCVCLTENYYVEAKVRSEIQYAFECNKPIMMLQVDNEGRDECWLQPYLANKKIMDFADPFQDKISMPALLQAFGKAGKKEELLKAEKKQHKTVAPPKVEEKKVEEEEKEEESVKDAEYRPPVTSSRGVVSALDSLPPEEREKLLAARRIDSDKVLGWSVDEVAEWLDQTLQLGQYRKQFVDGKVDGNLLVSLTDEDLAGGDLCISSRLHRKKVLTRVKQMLGT